MRRLVEQASNDSLTRSTWSSSHHPMWTVASGHHIERYPDSDEWKTCRFGFLLAFQVDRRKLRMYPTELDIATSKPVDSSWNMPGERLVAQKHPRIGVCLMWVLEMQGTLSFAWKGFFNVIKSQLRISRKKPWILCTGWLLKNNTQHVANHDSNSATSSRECKVQPVIQTTGRCSDAS